MMKTLAVLFLLSLFYLSAWATTDWYPCSVLSPVHPNSNPILPYASPSFDLDQELRAQCRMITVPHMYDGSTGETIDVFVKRIFQGEPVQGKDQFWMLQGGPGGAGEELEPVAVKLMSDPDFHKITIYLPDHRGVGRSHRLSCPNEDNVWECKKYVDAKYGDFLHGFTSTNAARDLIRQIDTCRNNMTHPNEKVWLYGLSYGTYWAQRYLSIIETERTPYQADAVILDSACAMEATHLSEYDLNVQRAGMSFMTRCQKDVNCRRHFEMEDPITDLYEVWFQVRENIQCAGKIPLLTPAKFSALMYSLVMIPHTRPLVPALIHRMKRCTPADIQTINRLFEPQANAQEWVDQITSRMPFIGGAEGYPNKNGTLAGEYGSMVLGWNIMFSELWTGDGAYSPVEHSPEAVRGFTDTSIFASHLTVKMSLIQSSWNHYKSDQYWWKYPKTKRPLLLLHGDLDQATPYPWAPHIAQYYPHPTQHFYRMPMSTHGTIAQTLMHNSKSTCAWEIIKSFLYESMTSPDVSCLDHLEPIDFEGKTERTRGVSEKIWGTRDIWGVE